MIRPIALVAAQILAVASILASLLVLAGRHPMRIDLSPDSSLEVLSYLDYAHRQDAQVLAKIPNTKRPFGVEVSTPS